MSSHEWHQGELYVQSALGYKEAVAGAHPNFLPRLTSQHQQFHTSLEILPVCTLDGQGRPWGSFLTSRDGSHGFIKSPSLNSLIATNMNLHKDHPVETALREGAKFGMTQLVLGTDTTYQGPGLKLIAGVGVMFENRRRNKFAGFIDESNVGTEADRTIQMEVMTSLGNCPKYISTRSLVANPNHMPTLLHKEASLSGGQLLPKETLQHIAQADTVFLATRYTSPVSTIFKSNLGMNIRGGKPGFVRLTTEISSTGEEHQVAYLPDYSGNRFMSSLGNIHFDKVAGITVPLMKKGKPIDVVYLTGDANVLIGEESRKVFLGVNTCVRVEITGFMHVKDAVPLMPGGFNQAEVEGYVVGQGDDGVGWSPYNPPVRRLRSELSMIANPSSESLVAMNEAKIVGFEQHAPDLATITFKLSQPVNYTAGQHVILDCATLLDPDVKEYKHMSDKRGGEKELNDTGLRTWTISSAPKSRSTADDTLKVTMRRAEGGLITPKVFEIARRQKEVALPVLGVGGDFVLPQSVSGKKMLWIASGVGITPFLSFLKFLTTSDETELDVTIILSVRRAEAAVMLELIHKAISSNSPSAIAGKLHIHVVSAGIESLAKQRFDAFKVAVTKHSTRLNPDLLLEFAGKEEKSEVWVCGPPSLETSVLQTLEGAGWGVDKIHRESFAF
ncbi:uncharacterized protein MEPE_00604 [Melanopsichium pennsylvanicum]|uniref:FAD-binding FR-type domain-containing protein n=2 Tax=Melanopsichium pennsylvanicum TaxID=63383 RepID=A0AAJ5C2Y5_9BASI|nr:uncharacterized protein MEPE_00604 [Melanopsichium pennsylvanicum]